MKKFKTPVEENALAVTNKISVTLSLIMILVVFSFATAYAQTQKAAEQKPVVKSETTSKQTATQKENTSVPVEKKDLPVINDALINVKDEKQYFEQKKKEQEKNIGEKKEINEPK